MLTKSTQRGFSLIELMVVIVIVGILFMLGAPSYGMWIQNQQIRAAAESILNGIQVARSEAVKNNGQASFVLCGPLLLAPPLPAPPPVGARDSSWEVVATSSAAAAPTLSQACVAGTNAATNVSYRVQERSSQEGSRLAQVVVTASLPPPIVSPITSDGTTTITFNSFGRVVGATNATIEVTTPVAGSRTLWIKVGQGGNTRMCDPAPLLAATDPRHC